jgi:hypothetical protein
LGSIAYRGAKGELLRRRLYLKFPDGQGYLIRVDAVFLGNIQHLIGSFVEFLGAFHRLLRLVQDDIRIVRQFVYLGKDRNAFLFHFP